MNTIKPATPLPWKSTHPLDADLMRDAGPGESVRVDGPAIGVATLIQYGGFSKAVQDARYIVAAANEYPRLAAENARLRAALAAISVQPFQPTNNGERWDEGYRRGWNAALNGAHEIARAALAEGAE